LTQIFYENDLRSFTGPLDYDRSIGVIFDFPQEIQIPHFHSLIAQKTIFGPLFSACLTRDIQNARFPESAITINLKGMSVRTLTDQKLHLFKDKFFGVAPIALNLPIKPDLSRLIKELAQQTDLPFFMERFYSELQAKYCIYKLSKPEKILIVNEALGLWIKERHFNFIQIENLEQSFSVLKILHRYNFPVFRFFFDQIPAYLQQSYWKKQKRRPHTCSIDLSHHLILL
jgi:hypothetical protein